MGDRVSGTRAAVKPAQRVQAPAAALSEHEANHVKHGFSVSSWLNTKVNLVELFLQHPCLVSVLSYSDWGWALAFRQLGAQHVACRPLSDLARGLLHNVREVVPGLTADEGSGTRPWLVVMHLTETKQLDDLRELGLEAASRLVMSCPSARRRQFEDALRQDSAVPGLLWASQRFCHADLGGLTALSVHLMWANPSDPAEGRTAKFTPSHESIRRSPEGFLEPAVALADWANPSSLGAPMLNGEGTPLGFKVSPGVAAWDPMVSYLPSPVCGWTWVMAKTILSGNRLIARPFAAKEKGQILDLREDWQDAAAHTWTALKGTGIDPFPARVGTEFGIIALNWWAPHFARGEGKVARPVGWDRPRVVPGARPSESQASALIQGVFGSLVEPTDALTISVAVKSDKASVDTSMWNVGGSSRAAVRAREVLQRCLHRRWYCRLEREALAWLNQEAQQLAASEEQRANGEAIRDCLRRARNSTWFEWNDGSRLFFWRWPPDLQREARDGSPVCHHYIPPRRCDARVPSDVEPWMAAMVNDKLRKFFRRRYIIPFPRRLTRVPIVYFPVKKGEEDIRMVWSETEQGITDSVFAPRIFYPEPRDSLATTPQQCVHWGLRHWRAVP